MDYDENIRKQVVAVICDVAVSALTSIPTDTIKLVAERLRDKSVRFIYPVLTSQLVNYQRHWNSYFFFFFLNQILVKTYTMERLTELYRVYCLRCAEGKVGTGDFDWIPGKFLKCLYDKDFRYLLKLFTSV